MAFAFIKAAIIVLLVSVAERVFPVTLLGLYLLTRRLASTLPNLTGLGVSNTLQRYIPLNANSPAVAGAFAAFGAAAVLVLNGAIVLLAMPFGQQVADWFFPGQSAVTDAVPLALWTVGLCAVTTLQFVVNGFMLGTRRVLLGQIGDTMAVGGWALVGFAMLQESASPLSIVRFQTVAMLITTLCALSIYLIRSLRAGGEGIHEHLVTARNAVTRYGLTRAAVTFLDALLITAGPWLVRQQPSEMGYFLVALTFLRIGSTALTPVSKVVSVSVSSLLGREDRDAIGLGINLMIGVITVASVLSCAALLPFASLLLELWLNDRDTIAGVGKLILPMLLALPATALFNSLKGLVDVTDERPRNLANLTIALGVLVVGAYAGRLLTNDVAAAAWAMFAAQMVLAATTISSLRQWLAPVSYFAPVRLLLASGLVWALGMLVSTHVDTANPMYAFIASVLAMALLVGGGAIVFGCGRSPLLVADLRGFLKGRGQSSSLSGR